MSNLHEYACTFYLPSQWTDDQCRYWHRTYAADADNHLDDCFQEAVADCDMSAVMPPSPATLISRPQGFLWGQWVEAYHGDTAAAVDGWLDLVGDADRQYYLVEPMPDGYRSSTEVNDLCNVWDGGVSLLSYHDGRKPFAVWLGADGPSGGSGQSRFRPLEYASRFKPL